MTDYSAYHYQSTLSEAALEGFSRELVFVETGSNVGSGIQRALECQFNEVHSIEGDERFYHICKSRFRSEGRVHLYHGPSPQHLAWILTTLEMRGARALIFLDTHAEGDQPLLQELAVIRDSGQSHHIILIDDVRMFGSEAWGLIGWTEIESLLRQINPLYTITLRSSTYFGPEDILVAQE